MPQIQQVMPRHRLRPIAKRFTSVHKPCEWIISYSPALARCQSCGDRRKLPHRELSSAVISTFGSKSTCRPSLGRSTLKMLTRQPAATWAAAQAARLMTGPP